MSATSIGEKIETEAATFFQPLNHEQVPYLRQNGGVALFSIMEYTAAAQLSARSTETITHF
jgi:hypothetical protein